MIEKDSTIRQELKEIAADLRHVIANLERVSDQAEGEIPGLLEARNHVDTLMWETSSLLFWSNYAERSKCA